LAQVEVLGIFAVHALDAATRWAVPNVGSAAEQAFKVFLNYNGQGAKIAGDSVYAQSSDYDQVGVYAFQNSTSSAIWIVLVNKVNGYESANVTVNAQVTNSDFYRFDASNPTLSALGTASWGSKNFTITLTPWSVTLIVIPASGSITNSLPTVTVPPPGTPSAPYTCGSTSAPTPTSGPTPSPTPHPTPKPTPNPTPKPTPKPTPSPTPTQSPGSTTQSPGPTSSTTQSISTTTTSSGSNTNSDSNTNSVSTTTVATNNPVPSNQANVQASDSAKLVLNGMLFLFSLVFSLMFF